MIYNSRLILIAGSFNVAQALTSDEIKPSAPSFPSSDVQVKDAIAAIARQQEMFANLREEENDQNVSNSEDDSESNLLLSKHNNSSEGSGSANGSDEKINNFLNNPLLQQQQNTKKSNQHANNKNNTAKNIPQQGFEDDFVVVSPMNNPLLKVNTVLDNAEDNPKEQVSTNEEMKLWNDGSFDGSSSITPKSKQASTGTYLIKTINKKTKKQKEKNKKEEEKTKTELTMIFLVLLS